MNLSPLPGYVMLEVVEDNTMRKSGFVMPDSVKDKPARGRVLKSPPKGVDIGKLVIFKRWEGTTIKEEGKDLVFIDPKHILGVYDG